MGSSGLKSLTLTAFRGSTQSFVLEFEKGTKLALIYGENGAGKTTICDAFEFLASERIGSLEDRGMGKGLERFWPAAGKPAHALAVDLETSAGKCSGRIVNKKISISPATGRPRIELLRHRQILELIQAQPSKRYEAIKRFIDIESFERSEDALRQHIKILIREKEGAQTAEQENLATLQAFYEGAGKPARLDAVAWAQRRLSEPTSDLDADISAISNLRTAFHLAKTYSDNLAARRTALTAAKIVSAGADERLKAVSEAAGDNGASRLELLLVGQTYIRAHPHADACPLCDSAENITGLAEAIGSKLQQLESLEAATQKWKQAHDTVKVTTAALLQAEAECQSAVRALVDAQSTCAGKEEVALPATPPPAESADLSSWLVSNEGLPTAWASAEAKWRDESRSLAQLKFAVARYTENAGRVADLSALIPKMEEALSQCIEERQEFTDSIVSEIAKDVGMLYERVHPGEGLEKIALELDRARRASLNLGSTFAGLDAPPQAYFSQSHLDTLGLCIFLALARRDRPAETVLILDDVLGSVDEPHVERVIDMIYEVSTAFLHTIVTTHYRPWRYKYRWGWLRPGQPCQFVELANWDYSDGIRIINALPEIDRLRSLLGESPVDLQAVSSKAGVILEAVLDYLTQKYECAVPRRNDGSYTIGDLLPAIRAKLRKALKVEMRDGITDAAAPATSTVELKPILDELAHITGARNAIGAHFKDISFELAEADAIRFARVVLSLAETLICPIFGWPSNSHSGSYWRNSGDTRRLHPLKTPS